MEKLTYAELKERFCEHNRNHRGEKPLTAIIVFSQSNWKEIEYSERQRSYKVRSDCWGFMDGKISNAVYGDCLDGIDLGVRLDWYKWEPDYCYLIDADAYEGGI